MSEEASNQQQEFVEPVLVNPKPLPLHSAYKALVVQQFDLGVRASMSLSRHRTTLEKSDVSRLCKQIDCHTCFEAVEGRPASWCARSACNIRRALSFLQRYRIAGWQVLTKTDNNLHVRLVRVPECVEEPLP